MHVVSPDPIPTTLRTWKPGARKPRIPDQASPKPRRGDESGPGRSERVAAWNAAAQVLAVRAAEERCLVTAGRATLWPVGGGPPFEIRQGDWATFRRGFLCTWVVHEPIASGSRTLMRVGRRSRSDRSLCRIE